MKNINLRGTWMMVLFCFQLPFSHFRGNYLAGTSSAFVSGMLLLISTIVSVPAFGGEDLQVVVKPGDTLMAIVKRELETLDAWRQVASHNKLEKPDQLSPGDVIVIPFELLNFGKIVFTKGEVEHHSGTTGVKQSATKGSKIFIGDVIKTGEFGFVSLSFNGSTLVNIQPDSEVRIELLDCLDADKSCVINLRAIEGQLNLDVKNEGFKKPAVFTIETPYASAAVRGTKLDFEIDNGNVLGVTEGTVVLSIAGESISVPQGKGSLAGEGRSIKTLYNLLPEPVFGQADSDRFSAEDYLTWNLIDGAVTYAASIVDSQNSLQLIRSYIGDVAAIKTDFDEGEYFVSVRGLDENKLKGFVSGRRFQQLQIDEETVPPELEMELSSEILKIKPDGTDRVEVRLGTELEIIDSDIVLMDYKTYEINAGETFETRVNRDKILYILGRKLVSHDTVSKYGQLYEFAKINK